MKFNCQSFFNSYKTNFGNLTQPHVLGLENLLNFLIGGLQATGFVGGGIIGVLIGRGTK